MKTEMEVLEAELQAIDLWDRLFVESEEPAEIEKDASNVRSFRRVQIILRMEGLAGSLEGPARNIASGKERLPSYGALGLTVPPHASQVANSGISPSHPTGLTLTPVARHAKPRRCAR